MKETMTTSAVESTLIGLIRMFWGARNSLGVNDPLAAYLRGRISMNVTRLRNYRKAEARQWVSDCWNRALQSR